MPGEFPGAGRGTGLRLLIERTVMLLLFGGLVLGVLAVLWPFATAILFGTILSIAAWPLRDRLLRLGLSRGLATTVLLLIAFAVVVLPVLAIAPGLAEHVTQGGQRLRAYAATDPPAPAMLAGLPIVGERIARGWEQAVHAQGGLRALLEPYSVALRQAVVAAASALAASVLQIILALVVASMFWIGGESLASALRDILFRLGGKTAAGALDVVGGAVRGVAYGVVGTAAIQAAVMALGLLVAGVPGAGLLGFVTLLLALSQIGAPLIIVIWAGGAFWLFDQGQQGWAVFLIIWGIGVTMMDNVIKPWLIGFGVAMPMSLTILGVFGGFVSFGFLGLFIGPSLIAVAYTLLQSWRAAPPSAAD
ncbi:AI-2E family transporter [Roseococcus sp. YIM B11640]|uniref:AI-2E family transporter n=1 Tax=Roseococcus sp. YIM B11640 TaxID=3133973 RepID=UPI003C7A874D